MLSLLQPKLESESELAAKREVTARLVASNKARAAAILLQALQHLEANQATVTQKKERIL